MSIESYAQSGQYHTIVESRVRLTWYQSYALNLVMSIESYAQSGQYHTIVESHVRLT